MNTEVSSSARTVDQHLVRRVRKGFGQLGRRLGVSLRGCDELPRSSSARPGRRLLDQHQIGGIASRDCDSQPLASHDTAKDGRYVVAELTL